MPDYNYTITVPVNTKREGPVITEMVLCKGVLAGGEIYFPPGCHGLCHVVIANGRGQLYPANAEDSFHGDQFPVPLVGRYKLGSAPYKLFAICWNLDDTYSHTPQVHLAVLTEEEISVVPAIRSLTDMFKRLLGVR